MKRTILQLMGLILVLQGILTIGLTMQVSSVPLNKCLHSKESSAIVMGMILFLLAHERMGGYYENRKYLG